MELRRNAATFFLVPGRHEVPVISTQPLSPLGGGAMHADRVPPVLAHCICEEETPKYIMRNVSCIILAAGPQNRSGQLTDHQATTDMCLHSAAIRPGQEVQMPPSFLPSVALSLIPLTALPPFPNASTHSLHSSRTQALSHSAAVPD